MTTRSRIGPWLWLALLGATGLAACGARSPSFSAQQKLVLPGASARGLQVSPDAAQWLVVNDPADVRLYADLKRAPRERGLSGLQSAGFLSAGHVYAASRERVELWGANLSESVAQLALPAHDPALSGHWTLPSPNARFVARDHAVYDTKSNRWLVEAAPHGHQTALAFSGDEWLLTAGYHDQTVVVRNLLRNELFTWRAPQRVTGAVFDPARKQAYVATEGGVFAWALEAKAGVRVGAGKVTALCLVDGSRSLATLGERSLRLFETRALRERAAFALASEGTQVACDGTLVAGGDAEGRVYAWEAAGQPRALAAGRALSDSVAGLAISARRQQVLASSFDARSATLVLLDLPR